MIMLAAFYEHRGAARDVLRVDQLPDPVPARGELLVRVEASGVNPTDAKARQGAPGAAGRAATLPGGFQIPHHDGAGTVVDVGPTVARNWVGRRVWLHHAALDRQGGTAAELTALPEALASELPDTATSALGAGLGIPFMTAHACLFGPGPIKGATVLVTGGAGAVGNAAIQLARQAGAHVVATASTPAKQELARSAGAHAVLDYRTSDLEAQLRGFADGGFDRVVDVAVATNLPSYLDALAPGATISAYARDDAQEAILPVAPLMARNASVRFVLVYGLDQAARRSAIEDINDGLRAGALTPLPTHEFPLHRIAEAHEAVEAGRPGKTVVVPGAESSL